MKRFVVIGSGAAGLAAAYKIRRAAEAGNDVDVLVLEREGRVGGKLLSEVVASEGGGEYVVDGGADAFLTSKPAVARIAKLLGVFDDIVPTKEENKTTFIVKGKRLIPMPDGIMMFAPTKLIPMATTPLYSWPAKFRMALDLFIPRKEKWPAGDTAQQHDETLESFVVRRMGQECLDRLAEPLVGGVHASDPQYMSLAATFPNLLEMEQKFGSLIGGFLDARKKVDAMKKKYPPKPGAKPRTFFSSFAKGMQDLPLALAKAVGNERIRLNAAVRSVARSADGTYTVTLESGEEIVADAVIVATEAWAASPLAAGVDARIGELCASIPYSSSATVSIALDASDFPHSQKFFGILSPLVEGRPMMALTLSSSKWPDRVPAGQVLMRGFVGGPRDQEILEKSDEELIAIIRQQIEDLLGAPASAQARYAKVFRWKGGMPQYTMGHLERVDEIEARMAAIPGFALAGGGYRGVGVPNCIEGGEKAVSRILGEWGIELAEDAAEEKRIY